MKSAKNIVVTAALPYANGSIHIGHLVEYIQTDILVRFLKLIGKNACFICADDTHGTPIELNAMKLGIKPEELIEKFYKEHTKDFKDFNIHFDSYYSTNSKENKNFAEMVFLKLKDAGYIYQKEVEQMYSPTLKRFLPDRYVKGKCPKCKAEDQYGDVCEKCNSAYKPTDLIDPYCVIDKSKPVVKKSTHYFFKLSSFSDFLKDFLKERPLQPEMRNFVMNWIKEGLQDWCISRDAPYFGFKIPGEKDKYFYVWLDAPIGYLSSLANYKKGEKQGLETWNADDTYRIHVIGKDIIYFHFLFWPSMLKGSGLKVPDNLLVHGFLTVNKEKMSKSRGTFITARQYLDVLDPEYLRYYFASHLSSKMSDLDLDLNDFKEKINHELIANIANLAYRAISFTNKNFEGKVTTFDEKEVADEIVEMEKHFNEMKEAYEKFNFREVIKLALEISSIGNKYMQDNAPWKLIKEDEKKTQEVLTFIINIIKNLSIALAPVMPIFSQNLQKQLNVKNLTWQDINFELKDHKLGKGEILVKKIEDEAEKLVQTKFPCEIRVGKIIEAKQHPNAEKLYILQIDLGKEKRQIVAGLKGVYELDELKGRKVLVLCNLKPAKLRGEMSNGMVMGGEHGKKYILAEVEKSEPGDSCYFTNPAAKYEQIDFKEFEKIHMKTHGKKIVYEGLHLKTDKEDVSVDIDDNAKVY